MFLKPSLGLGQKIRSEWRWNQPYRRDMALKACTSGSAVSHGQRSLFCRMGHHMPMARLTSAMPVNKILKDIVLRYKVMRRVRVRYRPGWDCHGLPIELKALSQISEDHTRLQPLAIRAAAARFASEAVALQRDAFGRWGLLADWRHVYLTASPAYVSRQLAAFQRLHAAGLVYRGLKPVHWSPSSRTALAEAELQYNPQHASQAAHVRLLVEQHHLAGDEQVFLLIWTTTPWTLPANQAVCFNEAVQYALFRIEGLPGLYALASAVAAQMSQTLGRRLELHTQLSAADLSQWRYRPPVPGRAAAATLPVLPAGHVTVWGTGLVHTAPAHGPDDFQVALRHRLPVEALVDEDGCYTAAAGSALHRRPVLTEGDALVLQMIGDDAVHVKRHVHSYPYDWRTNQPVLLRASRQWFIDTERLKRRALECLSDVIIRPDSIQSNMADQLRRRPYWCISRQRVWGVPIPAFYERDSGEPIVTGPLVTRLCRLVEECGTDVWWQRPEEELLPPEMVAEYRASGRPLPRKGDDVMDIWLDSGLSWCAAEEGEGADGGPADLYLEGLDQFTGWFQSSLLTSVALRDRAPYRSIFVHGFVMDEHGRKMSKSLGNVVDPTDVIAGSQAEPRRTAYGADCLRLWVAGHATHNTHITVGEAVLRSCAERLHKVRNTVRFLLGMLHRHDAARPQAPAAMAWLDRYMLHRLAEYVEECADAYDKYQFNRVLALLYTLVNNELSGLYIHATRHRLYCGDLNSEAGRSGLTVMHHVLTVLRQTMAPILPHLAEELVLYGTDGDTPVFKRGWPAVPDDWRCPEAARLVMPAVQLRDLLHKLVPSANLLAFDATLTLQEAEPEWRDAVTALQRPGGQPCADSQLASYTRLLGRCRSQLLLRHGTLQR
ncbi:isoleucine--tRNA ligase, mitochondrial-like [Pollicipes pollicipes]|uniref:isoleucine--tRNA ligase, mitochondrial-like n=1 Tax=Pollicipes pollicipes TaxID=41117 RepID=UPI0018857536|nr:isoleucine--tRNA ligase, mitochondrial-like [Pollicipes pollicipes]